MKTTTLFSLALALAAGALTSLKADTTDYLFTERVTSGSTSSFRVRTVTPSTGLLSINGSGAIVVTPSGTFADASHNQAWSTITSRPTTLSGYGITDAQPLDSDLTSLAALTTTSHGRSLLTGSDAAATRSTLGLVIGTNVQAYDANTSILGSSISLSSEVSGSLPLGNIAQSGATTGQVLAWSGSAWAPATAGGGGSTLVRATASAYGDYTLAATGPILTIDFANHIYYSISLDANGTNLTFTGQPSDPSDGSIWLDTSGGGDVTTSTSQLQSAMAGQGINVTNLGTSLRVIGSTPGFSSVISYSVTNVNVISYENGTDESFVTASGPAPIIPISGSKKVKIVAAWVTHNGTGSWQIYDPSTTDVVATSTDSSARYPVPWSLTGMGNLMNGSGAGSSYVLDSEGQTTVWMIAEQY